MTDEMHGKMMSSRFLVLFITSVCLNEIHCFKEEQRV